MEFAAKKLFFGVFHYLDCPQLLAMRFFWNALLQAQGWTFRGSFPHHLPKAVVIVGPHTSSWDFVIGLAVRSKLNLHHLKFLGKDSLFKGPFGFFFRRLGGVPVDRFSANNMVDQVVHLFQTNDAFVLALSPEGTRKKVERLRTGFYHIALKAKVPIVMAGMDFGKKELVLAEPFLPSGNADADFEKILSFYAPLRGKIPAQGLQHLYPPR